MRRMHSGFVQLPILVVLGILFLGGGALYFSSTSSVDETDKTEATEKPVSKQAGSPASKSEQAPLAEKRQKSSASSKATMSLPTTGTTYPPTTNSSYETLKRELEWAVSSGSEISPGTRADIEAKIAKLEKEGLRGDSIDLLKGLLSQLTVGGTVTATPNQNYGEPDPTKPPIIPWETDAVTWVYWQGKHTPRKTPPPCPNPLTIQLPVESSLVESVLYPGQVRSGDFKPHGGLILKVAPGASVEIRAPMDGYLTSVAKFTDEFGLHYNPNFQHSCGIAFGFGHLGAVSPKIQAAFDTVPQKPYKDSRTEIVEPIFVKHGEVVGTALQERGRGFDFGVSDFRQENKASKRADFREKYSESPWADFYGVCWFDLLPPEVETAVRALPAGDMYQGSNSEYCS